MSIAIVSLACRFPGAASAAELWDNVLEGRRAFRAMPAGRLDVARYAVGLVGEANSITRIRAGLISDWHFDCARYRIPQQTFKAADFSHWLALEVAADAVARAGGLGRIDTARTAVVVANTLTGEFSRASLLRLRAPFLDDVLAEALDGMGMGGDEQVELRRRFAQCLRARFPAPDEELLAGGLANTIAGRISNYFDLYGGAYSVDGACASSLVAVANAAEMLVREEADAVVVGGVDLSLDPFELVGFSRNGALASDDMRVFDARPTGFWPGEGCGFAVLMRADEARRREFPVLALLRGWGLSTDGAGGFTRPSVDGQVLALNRAYARANVDPADVGYIEAHGTGTAVGDPVEVRALAAVRAQAIRVLPIGSIKANIGHTKAAAGFAGLIKTVAALRARVVPPHVSCASPHPVFSETGLVRPALETEAWGDSLPGLAGVSGFGFGGINAHVVLEGDSTRKPAVLPRAPRAQDAELFLFGGERAHVVACLQSLEARAPSLSLAEFADAAAHAPDRLRAGPVRVAVVAAGPEELATALARAIDVVEGGEELLDFADGVAVGNARASRMAFLFPGQAAPSRPQGGLWARRFDGIRSLLAGVPTGPDPVHTAVAQPAIVAASLAAVRLLSACGVAPAAVCGHSVGEVAALAAAGALSEPDAISLAAARGAAMAKHAHSGGGMLRLAAAPSRVSALIEGLDLVIACHNAADEIVISGPKDAIEEAHAGARRAGVEATRLAVSHAFHSPMMAPATGPFATVLDGIALRAPQVPLVSTITGNVLRADEDVGALLKRQIEAPVLFEQALRHLASRADLLIEVGPGAGLTRLARYAGLSAQSVDACGDTLRPLLGAIGIAFVHGQQVDIAPLFVDRCVRPIDLSSTPVFLASPCGRVAGAAVPAIAAADAPPLFPAGAPAAQGGDVLTIVRGVVAEETGFAAECIGDDDRFLDDLHLSSIAVARMVNRAAQLAGLSRVPNAPTEFANASAAELAAALVSLRALGVPDAAADVRIPGVRPWVREFVMTSKPAAPERTRRVRWRTAALGPGPPPSWTQETRDAPADGVLIWIADGGSEQDMAQLVGVCQGAWADDATRHLAICHAGAPVSAFARSLAAEQRFSSVTVIEREPGSDDATPVTTCLQCDGGAFREFLVEPDGSLREPCLAVAAAGPGPAAALGSDDVIVVTGGGKGIAAECALHIGRDSGAALILVGRSPADDPDVRETCMRARADGLRCRYAAADVCDAAALVRAVAEAAREFGQVTALVHAAGINEPMRFSDVDQAALRRVMDPKVAGLRAVVAASGPGLRRLVVFGSIIGRIGLAGEAHYALANAVQTAVAEALARECGLGVLCLEWSIWNGAGMGLRLGSIDRLARQGIDAIALDVGVRRCAELVQRGAVGRLIVTSWFGPPPDMPLTGSEMAARRFIDRTLVYYPAVELIVETAVTAGRDQYLQDHCIDGLAILPGVIGLEAMAQVACALVDRERPASITDVAFCQAVVVSEQEATRIRIVTLAGPDGSVEAAIRAEDDGFAADRMRAVFRFEAPDSPVPLELLHDGPRMPAVDAAPLYGTFLFQGERFRRIRTYSWISARRIAADLDCASQTWFSPFEPQHLVLGDPAGRDALLHALQAAVPHLRVVPVAAERIDFWPGGAPVALKAIEISAAENVFVFDIAAFDASGALVEYWHRTTFHSIAELPVDSVIAIVPQLAAAYVERMARASTEHGSIEVALVAGAAAEPRRASALAALALDGCVFSRVDGKPIVCGGETLHVSIAHCDDFTLAVKARCEVACDIEPMSASPPANGANGTGPTELFSAPALRRWTSNEVAIKRNLRPDLPCVVHTSRRRDVITFETTSGRTTTIHVGGLGDGLMVAIGTPPPGEQPHGNGKDH